MKNYSTTMVVLQNIMIRQFLWNMKAFIRAGRPICYRMRFWRKIYTRRKTKVFTGFVVPIKIIPRKSPFFLPRECINNGIKFVTNDPWRNPLIVIRCRSAIHNEVAYHRIFVIRGISAKLLWVRQEHVINKSVILHAGF
jgi:hypothetical protein